LINSSLFSYESCQQDLNTRTSRRWTGKCPLWVPMSHHIITVMWAARGRDHALTMGNTKKWLVKAYLRV
jgi:hypothetical protein